MSNAVAGWPEFFGAVAGAAGALAGLVFVGLSINLARILALTGVAARAGETILLLAAALVGALVALVPFPSAAWLGAIVLALGALTWLPPTGTQLRALSAGVYHRLPHAIGRLALHQLATLPYLVAGLSLLGWFGGGLYWLATSLVLSLVVALINAWVLLVEILR